MRKVLVGLLGLLLCASSAWAGDFALAHKTITKGIPIRKYFIPAGGSFATFADSTSPYLWATSNYTVAMQCDTTVSIPLTPSYYTTWLAADSLQLGELVINMTAALGSADSIGVAIDCSPDGVNWVSGGAMPTTVNSGLAGIPLLRMDSVAPGSSSVTRMFTYRPQLVPAAGLTTSTTCNALAIRFRIELGTTSAVKQIASISFVRQSASPDENR